MSNARRRLTLVLVAVAIVAALGVAALTLRRARRESAQRDARAQVANEGPKVFVTSVALAPPTRLVTLPGDVRAFWQTILYAKVAGYVRDLPVDKGDRVRRGQVLAHIESPETDHQVAEAQATVRVRRRAAARQRELAPNGAASQQELDQAISDLGVAENELRRLKALQEYEILRAPFDGIVTARFVDPGALLSASATGQPVVEVSSPDRVRVLVYVGQDAASFVRLGDRAELTIDQLPGVRVAATVRRIADALDPRSRTMLVEAWPEEGAIRLAAGTFAHVTLHLSAPPLPIVPAEAIVARGEQLAVALVKDRRVHYVPVELGLNDGRSVQVRSGVSAGDVIALSPPSDLAEGAPIQPNERQADDGSQRAGGARSARTPSR